MRHGRQRKGVKPLPGKIPKDLGLFIGLGWSLAIWMAGGALLGRWLNSHFAWKPWGLLSGVLLGIAGGVYTFYRTIRKLDKKE